MNRQSVHRLVQFAVSFIALACILAITLTENPVRTWVTSRPPIGYVIISIFLFLIIVMIGTWLVLTYLEEKFDLVRKETFEKFGLTYIPSARHIAISELRKTSRDLAETIETIGARANIRAIDKKLLLPGEVFERHGFDEGLTVQLNKARIAANQIARAFRQLEDLFNDKPNLGLLLQGRTILVNMRPIQALLGRYPEFNHTGMNADQLFRFVQALDRDYRQFLSLLEATVANPEKLHINDSD